MLKSIDYSVTFPTTGRTFQNRIEFAPGLTAITGRNEAGKSLNLEMIAYCLFGKSALRGLASDYKNLSATLVLEVLGKTVEIVRSKKETLAVDGDITAVGADAINREVPAMLGFGLDVFNIACAAQQGDLEALTKMRPTERRQMVDRLIGLDLLEGIEKECRAEAKSQQVVAQTLALNLIEPEKPVAPDGYLPSEEVEVALAQAQEHERERQRLLLITEPVAPVEPVKPCEATLEELEIHQTGRWGVIQERTMLEGMLTGIPEPRFNRDDLERAVNYSQYQEEVARRGPRPDYTREQLGDWQDIWDKKALLTREPVDCPKCSHHFIPSDPDLDVVAIEALPVPPITLRDITTQFRRLELWADPLPVVDEFVIPDLNKEIQAHARTDDRASLLHQLGGLVVPADRAAELQSLRDYHQQLAVYNERRSRYDAELGDFRAAHVRLGELADQSETVVRLHGTLAQSRSYEKQLVQFDLLIEAYNAGRLRFLDHQRRSDSYRCGATALAGARTRVKQQLAPELGRAASILLAAMTSGERRAIVIDEDFNILVDGQPLQTLSGSGKSVVNLALRIGLGQVLTSRVLPIFLGDEIDADCDTDRSNSIAATLQKLKGFLTQVIVVTHKGGLDADYNITI